MNKIAPFINAIKDNIKKIATVLLILVCVTIIITPLRHRYSVSQRSDWMQSSISNDIHQTLPSFTGITGGVTEDTSGDFDFIYKDEHILYIRTDGSIVGDVNWEKVCLFADNARPYNDLGAYKNILKALALSNKHKCPKVSK